MALSFPLPGRGKDAEWLKLALLGSSVRALHWAALGGKADVLRLGRRGPVDPNETLAALSRTSAAGNAKHRRPTSNTAGSVVARKAAGIAAVHPATDIKRRETSLSHGAT